MTIDVLPVGLPDDLLRRLEGNASVNLLGTPAKARKRGVDAMVFWETDRGYARELMSELDGRLRWVHVPWVGVEALMTDKVMSGELLLTNSRGAAGRSVAEYVMGGILAIAKDLPRHIRSAERRKLTFTPTRELHGATLLIVGLGDIGKHVARHARPFGMHIRAVTRRPARHWACESVTGPETLGEELERADFVVLSLPSTPQTRGMFDAKRIGRMARGSWLINVARGDIVDHDALAAALVAEKIGGAILDVFEPDPMPKSSPLWSMPNVVMTPHISSWTRQRFDKAFRIFERNIELFVKRRTLINQINVTLGY